MEPRHHGINSVQIKIQALHLSRTQSRSLPVCTTSLFMVFSVFLWFLFCFSFALCFLLLVTHTYTQQTIPSIELFTMGLLLSFRCSLTAFVIFALCVILYVCVSFYQATSQKLTNWLAGWLVGWLIEVSVECRMKYNVICAYIRYHAYRFRWKPKWAHINWQWTTLDMRYHFGKQTPI